MKSIKDLLNDNNFGTYTNYSKKSVNSNGGDIFDFLELINRWSEIVGERLAEHTIPLKMQNKSLTVLTSHPVYAQQLSFMETPIIMKIEKTFPQMQGHIRKIFFKADNAYSHKQVKQATQKQVVKQEFKQKWHKQSPQYKKLEQQALQNLVDIEDPELKEKLVSIYIQLNDTE